VILTEPVARYIGELHAPGDPVLATMRAHGERDGIPIVAAETGVLLELLAAATGALRAVEVGTAIGVSTLHLARGGAHVTSFEVDAERQAAARRYLGEAGLADRVDLRLQDAGEGLAALAGPFDLAFVDGPKSDSERHVARCLELLRPGGLLLVDNALMSGAVGGADAGGRWAPTSVEGQRALNAQLVADPRLLATVTAVGDGVALAVRR
jgi:predicted O-methyltransferase YrrM